MRASHTLFALASALPLSLAAATAFAHVDLLSPPARLNGQASDQLKKGPCGQNANMRTADKVTTFTPGQKVDIKIKEYVQHTGYFAVAFDPDGDNNFPFPIANMDDVNEDTDNPKTTFPLSATVLGLRTDKEKDCYGENAANECTISVTIPNVNCANCTLQVIQFMYDKLGDGNDNEYYYQCADIKIEGPLVVGSGGTGGGGAGGAASGGAGGAASGGAGASAGGSGPTTGGMPGTSGTTTAGTTATTAGSGGTGTVTKPGGGDAADEGGCGIAKRSQGGASILAGLGLLFALGRRRRSS